VPTLASLAGTEADRLQLERVAAAGFPGIRRSHGYVFQHLVDGEPTITSLAGALGITQQGASKQVRELEELGLVERREVPGDLRARTVALTAAGRAAIDAGRRVQAELEAELVATVGADKVAAAKEVLARLIDLTGTAGAVHTRSFPAPPA
jgi:DNA-binding MarR family transcriptional regulator